MSNDVDIKIDYSEFTKALNDYVDITGKTLSDSLNRCAKNIAIQAVKNTKDADKGRIQFLAGNKEFLWWKAWKLLRRINGHREEHNAKHFLRTGAMIQGMSKTEAMEIVKKQMKKRLSAVGFIRAFFSAMAKAIDGKSIGKKFQGITPSFTKAIPDKPIAEIDVKFDFKRSKATADKAEKILWETLQTGVDFATKDMRDYLLSKISEDSQRVSAK